MAKIVTSIHDLYRKDKLTQVAKGEKEDEFRRFHDFVFKYHILIPERKSLLKEEAMAIMTVEFSKYYKEISQKFITFFKDSRYLDIKRDQWSMMLLVFSVLTKKETYDVDGACIIDLTSIDPTIYDDFYKWLNARK